MAAVTLTTLNREPRDAPNFDRSVGPILCPPRAHQYNFLHHPGRDLGSLESLGNNPEPGRFLRGENVKRISNQAHTMSRPAALTERVQNAFQNVQCLFE